GRARSSSSRTISSARLSAMVTKLAGPLTDTCRCSISPKSRLSMRPALCAALIITLRSAERSMAAVVCPPQAVASRARLARLLDPIEPGLRRLLAGGANLRRLLLHEGVERNVADAAGLGDDVPLDRLDRIGRDAAADRQHVGEPVLRHRIALA